MRFFMLSLLLLGPDIVEANTIFGTTITGDCNALGYTNNHPDSLNVQLAETIGLSTCASPVPTGIADNLNSASGSYQGSVSPGALHGRLEAEASAILGQIPPTSLSSGSGADLHDYWFDTIVITSSTLPRGTQVNAQLTSILDSTVTLTQIGTSLGPGSDADATSILGFSPADAFSATLNSSAGLILDHPYTNPFAVSQDSQQLLTLVVGGTYTIEQQLILQTVLGVTARQNGDLIVDAHAIVDAGDTSLAQIDILTPGASYTTASGTLYATSTSTPEPSTFGFMLGATAWLCCVFRKARDSR